MHFLRSLVHRMGQELSQRSVSAQLPEYESFFHYTSGRWLYNEKEREWLHVSSPLELMTLYFQ